MIRNNHKLSVTKMLISVVLHSDERNVYADYFSDEIIPRLCGGG